MIKPIEIIEVRPFYLICRFNNGEIKKLFVEPIFQNQPNKLIAEKILNPDFFCQVQLGELGQIYWADAAQMKDEKGNWMSCEFDISPEFIYYNSASIG
jgi:hypothetical protein